MTHPIPAEDLLHKVAGSRRAPASTGMTGPGTVDGADLYEVQSVHLAVSFRSNALESVRLVESSGRALRVIREGRQGFSTTTDLADGQEIVKNALESAQFGDAVSYEFPVPQPLPAVQCFDPQVARLDEEALITLGNECIAVIRDYDPGLQVRVQIDKKIEGVSLRNTSGLDLRDRRTSFALSMEVTRTQEDDILIVYDSAASRQRQDVDGQRLARGLVERLRQADQVARVESKTMAVVFRFMGTLPLLLPLHEGLNGRQVYLGTSPLGEKLGQPIFDSRFTLTDHGQLDFARLSAPYDDEGMPTTEKPLIEGGVVRQFLYDLKTAAQAKARPTGNGFKSAGAGRRGFHLLPQATPATWIVSPGDHTLAQILQDLEEALVVEQVLGLGQGNLIAGEFSNNVALGFLARRGEIVGRVKNTMIAGNIYDLLQDRLIALSDQADWVYGQFRVPAVAVDGVGVVSKG